MNTIYTSDNYIIFEYSNGVKLSYPKTSTYIENPDSFSIRHVNFQSTFSIQFSKSGDWYDGTGIVAFTEATLRTFLRKNTGFKTVAGSSVTGETIYSADDTITGESRTVTIGDSGNNGYALNFQAIGGTDEDSSIELDINSIDLSTNKDGTITLTSVNNVDNTDFTVSTGVSLDSNTIVTAREIGDGAGGVLSTQNLTIGSTGMIIEDTTSETGLEYAADYSANYTDRSLVDKAWVLANGGGGSGDMTKAVYDPNTVGGDAFDMDNMIEGSTNKIFTSSDESNISTNNAKISYTDASAVSANTAKVGITPTQASDISDNNSKISYTDASAVSLNTAKISYTDSAAVTLNTAKISYTDASAVSANTAKVGITPTQASDITDNNNKISYTDSAAVALNTAKISYDSTSSTKVDGIEAGAEVNTIAGITAGTNITLDFSDPLNPVINASGGGGGDMSIATYDPTFKNANAFDMDEMDEGTTNKILTSSERSNIVTNTSKISYTDASAVSANTAKIGITAQQASDISDNNNKISYTDSAAVTLNTAKISYTDSSAVSANTAKVGITPTQASDITTNNSKVSYTDAAAVSANTAKISFDSTSSTRLLSTSGTNTGDQDLSSYLTSATAASTYEPLKGGDDNYVTDAQLIVIGNTSGTNTGDQDISGISTNAGNISTNVTAIGLNTAKTGITGTQASDITTNNSKISYTDASAVSANTAKISYTDAAAVSANTAKVGITGTQASDIVTNNAKISFDSTSSTRLLSTSGTNTGDQDLSSYLTSATAASTYEPLKGGDDNYVTDAELVVIGNTSGTNTGDQDTIYTADGTIDVSSAKRLISVTNAAQGGGKYFRIQAENAAQDTISMLTISDDGITLEADSSANLGTNRVTIKPTGSGSGLEILTSETDNGAHYAADYSALGEFSYGDRWIPDVGYVNTLIPADSAVIANTAKISFDSTSSSRLANTSGTNTGDQDLSSLALKTNVLELDNTTVFTPNADYEPATKKYVDDNSGGGGGGDTIYSASSTIDLTGATIDRVVTIGTDVSDYSTALKFVATKAANSTDTSLEISKDNLAIESTNTGNDRVANIIVGANGADHRAELSGTKTSSNSISAIGSVVTSSTSYAYLTAVNNTTYDDAQINVFPDEFRLDIGIDAPGTSLTMIADVDGFKFEIYESGSGQAGIEFDAEYGVYYSSDFSSTQVQGDRWLTDKGYVDTAIAAGGSYGLLSARYEATSATDVNPTTDTVIAFESQAFADTGFTNTTSTLKTVTAAARYRINSSCSIDGTTGNFRYTSQISIRKNGVDIIASTTGGYIRSTSGSQNTYIAIDGMFELAANDTIEILIKRISTTTGIATTTIGMTSLELTKMN